VKKEESSTLKPILVGLEAPEIIASSKGIDCQSQHYGFYR